MLKLLSTVILITLSITSGISQNIKNESKIRDFMGNERFDRSVQSNPGLIKFLDIKIEKGYSIQTIDSSKENDFTLISEITYNGEIKGEKISPEEFIEHSEKDNFNILFYDFPMPEEGGNGNFMLQGTNKIISVYSNDYLNTQL